MEQTMSKIQLKKPIAFGSEIIAELTFREPKALDMRQLPLHPKSGDILDLAARLSGQLPSTLNLLCIEDYQQVMNEVGSFFSPGPETSEVP